MEKRALKCFSNVILSLLALSITSWAATVHAQAKYPTKAIDIIVPFKPAGGTDSSARVVALFLSKKWQVPVNIVNKPGGNTLPGSMEVFDSSPDGYTVLADCNASSSMLPVVMKNIPYNIMDRTFLGIFTRGPLALMLPAKSHLKTIEDVKAEILKDPDNFTWASLGGVSGPDYIMRQFFKAVGADINKTKPVMGTGGADVGTLLAGGHVKFGGTNIVSAKAAIDGGLVRVIGIAEERNPDIPDVPTFAELGYPSINHVWWVGISGPPKMPQNVIDAWQKALEAVAKDPEFVSSLRKIGFSPYYLNGSEMKEYVAKDAETVANLYGLKKN